MFDIFTCKTQTDSILSCRETLGTIKTIQSSCHVGTLPKKAHITLTGVTFFHIAMERNKRNSIAGFPTRSERLNDDRDGTGGVGICEMGPPSQVSICCLQTSLLFKQAVVSQSVSLFCLSFRQWYGTD